MLNDAVLARMRGRLLAAATLVMGCHGKSAAPVHDVVEPVIVDAGVELAPPDAAVADAAVADAAVDAAPIVDAGRGKKAHARPDAARPYEIIILI